MSTSSKATIPGAIAFVFAVTASMLIATVQAESSLIVTQSTEDGLKVHCEGDFKCEITGDHTVVATSEDNSTSTIASSTILDQSETIQSENGFGSIDEQELGSRIKEMVNRILDTIFD